jgi:hypothetical protein
MDERLSSCVLLCGPDASAVQSSDMSLPRDWEFLFLIKGLLEGNTGETPEIPYTPISVCLLIFKHPFLTAAGAVMKSDEQNFAAQSSRTDAEVQSSLC